ncbi:hypothetical protein PVAP13_9NG344200 [Panicum virgatum]|jgi:hypothetical protein|uniref:Uncharacterized protein n=1 Tax=Panicum virgatum TaxID=38727 RepID=A0A8T0MK32_PANVG|nr:hypothetical protein PVAP13_9NG344200 [Panicum virgatum]
MASLVGQYTGGSGGRSSSAVKQLLWRLRSTWRTSAGWPRRPPVKFGYDLPSYSQNFDDGLGSCGGHRFR